MSVNWVEVCFSLECERDVTVPLQSWSCGSSSTHLKVNLQILFNPILFVMQSQAEDTRMQEIMKLAHEFLQNFCAGNQQNQALLHKHINLFLNPGVRTTSCHDLYFFFLVRKENGLSLGIASGPVLMQDWLKGSHFVFILKPRKLARSVCLGPFQRRKFKRLK